MFKKVIQRVPVDATDPVSDLIALIDLIEIELGLSTGGRSVRNRLFEVVSEIRRSESVASQESVSVLLEVIERLRKIERLLSDNGFETGSDETPRDPSNRDFGSGERMLRKRRNETAVKSLKKNNPAK
jgi:hypothetical protein